MARKITFYQDRIGEKEDWAVSYGDVVTLLLVFFIMLLGASKVSQVALDSIDITGKKPPIEKIWDKLTNIVAEEGVTETVSLKKDLHGIDITIKNNLLFASGEANISPQTEALIRSLFKKMIEAMRKLPENYRYEIEGHTDDNPISTEQFPSNWYLSSYRALAILNIFLEEGFNSRKFLVQGFADTRPIFSNRTRKGAPIINNQVKNRRAVIKIR